MVLRVDLGSGGVVEAGWLRLDISRSGSVQPDVQADIRHLPFKPKSLVGLRALHILEHIPREDLIPAMNNFHQALVPGGVIDIEVPLFPSDDAIGDPTHLSFFVARTFDYFLKDGRYAEHGKQYGIFPWMCTHRERVGENSILRLRLMKP